ncbi:MAG: ribonuclease H family protein [Clostridium sp.]|nr:ribonuclease H family protein [Clostridium sp.]
MAKKYYAVVKGRTKGIYFTWEDCRKQIHEYPGAEFKGFSTIGEAEQFIKANAESGMPETDMPASDIPETDNDSYPVSTDTHLIAYVDGSYDHSQLRYAYGCVLVLPEEVVTLNGSGADERYVSMRNVAGEILGSEKAVSWAKEHGYGEITIYYDYEGIEKWADGIWKANKPGTQRYQAFIAEKRNEMVINFQKVEAHTGVKYNEMADMLAKEALGI